MMKFRMVAIALAAGVLGGCATASPAPKVASANGGAGRSPKATASVDPGEQGRKWAACMRENGVAVDDPGPGGGLPPIPGYKNQQQMDTITKATEKCRPLEPSGAELGRPMTAADIDKLRVLAKCLRANGLPNYPDPDANGVVDIKSPLDPAAIRKAMEACRSAGSEKIAVPVGDSGAGGVTAK
jgi:hypothetical protein